MAPSRDPGRSARTGSRRPRGGLVETFADGSVALDLFGEVEAELARRDHAAALAAEFEARARRMPNGTAVAWVAPYDTLTARRGQVVPGWRCWLCGDVEGNAYALELAHGLHPGDPDALTRTQCGAQDRAAPTPATPDANRAAGRAVPPLDPPARAVAAQPDKETPR